MQSWTWSSHRAHASGVLTAGRDAGRISGGSETAACIDWSPLEAREHTPSRRHACGHPAADRGRNCTDFGPDVVANGRAGACQQPITGTGQAGDGFASVDIQLVDAFLRSYVERMSLPAGGRGCTSGIPFPASSHCQSLITGPRERRAPLPGGRVATSVRRRYLINAEFARNVASFTIAVAEAK